MSSTLNKVMLIGNLGDEVKMHYFEGGDSIGRFSIATNESYTNKQTGERIVNTDWHNVVVRNKAAEICEKYIGKGDKIYVEGRLKNRQWQGEDGITRYTTEIHVRDFKFLSAKKGNLENVQSNEQSPPQTPQVATPDTTISEKEAEKEAEKDDDLPF